MANCSTIQEAWHNAPPEHLIFMATWDDTLTRKELRLFMIWCLRQGSHLAKSSSCEDAIHTSLRVAQRYMISDPDGYSYCPFGPDGGLADDLTEAFQVIRNARAFESEESIMVQVAYRVLASVAEDDKVKLWESVDGVSSLVAGAMAEAAEREDGIDECEGYGDALKAQADWLRQNTKPQL